MVILAMWFQAEEALSDPNIRLLAVICLGVVALAMVALAIALVVLAAKSAKAIQGLAETVGELKQKAIPLMESATEISHSVEELLRENSPKLKVITDNLVETSDLVRGTAQHFERTLADANLRTQRQVARVDGMVSSALTTTVEIVEAIGNGIRVPAQKVAALAGQAKLFAEGLLARIRSFSGSTHSDSR